MPIKTILSTKGTEVFNTHPDTPLTEAANILVHRHIGWLLVLDEDHKISGAISERDIVRAAAENDGSLQGLAVRDVMTSDVLTCTSDDTLESVMNIMTNKRVRHLPVVDDDAIIGLVSIGDVMKHRLEEIQYEGDSLREYISGTGY